MRLAPRAVMHPPLAFGAPLPHRNWMLPTAPQQPMGFPCTTMMPSAGSMLSPSLMGHRPEGALAYATSVLMPVQQPCVQQFVVYGSGPEPSMASAALAGLPSQTMPTQQFGRQVIHLPPAVSEQASADGMLQVPFPAAAAQDMDFELSPPPPPVCSPNLPHSYASAQQHPTLPPPSAPPRLVVSAERKLDTVI